MNIKNVRHKVVAGLAMLAFVIGVWLWCALRTWNETRIIFLDIGQGDAILVAERNTQVLIDGGRDGQAVVARLGEYMPWWDRSLEMVVATHPDEDHIGGLVEVFNAYHVGVFMKTNAKSDTGTFKALENKREQLRIPVQDAFAGTRFHSPLGAEFEVLHPLISLPSSVIKDTNASSIVIKLTVGGNRFLFTGDLPSTQESRIQTDGIEVLKVGHHGSKYSTSEAFLNLITPNQAVVSVGKNNRYGHPAPEVLNRLDRHHIEIFRTDNQGSIVYHCPKDEHTPCKISFGR